MGKIRAMEQQEAIKKGMHDGNDEDDETMKRKGE